jgi:hypothetical protein
MDLDAYRRSAQAFLSELNLEYYRHYAGLKPDFEIEQIYTRHEELFERRAVDSLREMHARAAAGGEDRRRLTMLVDFAVDGFIGQATKSIEADIAGQEARLSFELDGVRIGLRGAVPAQANEPDAARRERIERERLSLIADRLNPLYRELIERQHALAGELGYASYRALCEECKDVDLGRLHAQTEAFRTATRHSYPTTLEPQLRRTLGIGLAELRHSDLPRLFRAPGDDASFPAERLVPSLLETLGLLGFAIEAQPGVVLDVEHRPTKSPRAFCAPVRTPGEVYLVISPVGGFDDYSALFHEAGHTEHAANVDPALAPEFRLMGDNSVSESYAFLVQHLVETPEWLERRLGVAREAEQLAAYARAVRLVYLRRYVGKLAYELELHGGGPTAPEALSARYAELLSDSVLVQWPRETFLADVDPGFYCSCYLRAWALETHLRAHLRERFGALWFESPEAGAVLGGLWRDGQRRRSDELLHELTGEPLDFRVLLADLGLS